RRPRTRPLRRLRRRPWTSRCRRRRPAPAPSPARRPPRRAVRGLLERLGLRLDVGDVVALERLAQLHDPTLDRRGLGFFELVAVLLERALRLISERLSKVLRVDDLTQLARLV